MHKQLHLWFDIARLLNFGSRNSASESSFSAIFSCSDSEPEVFLRVSDSTYSHLASTPFPALWYPCLEVHKAFSELPLCHRYFAPPDAPNGTKGTTLRSVRHALGPSFGTLSFSAAVLTLVDLARNALEQ